MAAKQEEKADYLSEPLQTFLADLASAAPTPGGGSAAALVGSIAASLGHMVCLVSKSRAVKQARPTDRIDALADRLERARRMLAGLIAEDIAAYSFWRETHLGGKDNAAGEPAEKAAATAVAISVPCEAMAILAACLEDLADLLPLASRYILADLAAAAEIGLAALEAARWMVLANLQSSEINEQDRERISGEIEYYRRRASSAKETIADFVAQKVRGQQSQ